MANANVIELLLKSVDQMTGDIRKVEAALSKVSGSTEALGEEAKETGRGLEYLNTAMTTLGAVSTSSHQSMVALVRALGNIQRLALPAAIAGITAAFFTLAKSVADVGTEFLRLERITGISLENLSALKVIAEQNESSFGELSIALRTFNRVIGSAVTQGGELRQTLSELGIQEQEINSFYHDSEAALETVAKKISALTSSVEKNRLAVQFFGRSGRDVLLLLEEIAKNGLEGARKKAEELGLLMGRDLADQSKKFNDNLTALAQTLDRIKLALGSPLIAAANNFLGVLERIFTLGQSGKIEFIDPKATGPAASEMRKALVATADRAGMEEAIAKEVARGMGKGGEEGMEEVLKAIREAKTEEALREVISKGTWFGTRTTTATNRIMAARQEEERLAAAGKAESLRLAAQTKDDSAEIISEMGKALRKQVVQIQSEITKTIATAQIALANEALAKTGNVDEFLARVRSELEKIRKAGTAQIARQFEEEKGRAGLKPAQEAQAARLEQQNEQIRAQQQALEKTARDMRDKVLDGLKKAQIDAMAVSIDAHEALIADQRKVVELGILEVGSMEEVVAKAKELAASTQELGRMRIESIEHRIALLREELDTETLTRDKAAEINVQIMKLGVEAQKVTTAMRDMGAEAVAFAKTLSDTKLLPAIESQATRARMALTLWQDALQELNDEAAIAGLADSRVGVSWNKILEITRQIDIVQQSILEKEVARQKIAVNNARFALEQKKGTQEQLDLEIAKLEDAQLRVRLSAGKAEREKLREFAMEADRIASGMAKNFVDRFIQGMRDGKADFMAIFNEIGETIASDLLQELVKGALLPQVQGMLKEGRKPADTLGGQLLDNIKYGIEDIFGIKPAASTKADPVVEVAQEAANIMKANSETEKKNIAEGADAGKVALERAGQKLTDSASALSLAAEKLATSGTRGPVDKNNWDYVGKQEERIASLQNEVIRLMTQPATDSATTTRQGNIYQDSNEAGWETLHEELDMSAQALAKSVTKLDKGGTDLQALAKKGVSTFSELATGIGTMAAGIAMLFQGGGSTFQKVGGGLTATAGFLGTVLKILPLFGGSAAVPASAHGNIFTRPGPLPAFAGGGMIGGGMGLNSIPIQKLKTGRTIGGPIAGVFGEEGSELVARIKPNKGGDDKSGEPIIQNVYLVDQRRPNLGPRDIELVVEDSARRGGPVSKGIQNVIKRSRG